MMPGCWQAGLLHMAMRICRVPAPMARCPSAGPSQYEVKNDVYDAAAGLPERDLLFPRAGKRMYFDLWGANALALQRGGVREENIEVARICTMSRTDLLYSFRREGAGCGHFGLIAGFVDA